MADYRYLLGNILTGDILAELPFTDVSYSHVLNLPGSFSGTMGLQQPEPALSVIKNAVLLGRNMMLIERDGVLVWGGMLWTRSVDFDAGTYTLNGEGWHSYFRRRHLSETKTYVATEQVDIFKDLIDWAQAQEGGNIGVETATVVATGVVRDRTYLDTERKNIGEALEQLAEVDDGFDFRYETIWQADTLGINLLTSYPATGRVTDLVFELGNQLSGLGVTGDATSLVTNVDAIGAIPEPAEGEEAGPPLMATVSDALRLSIMPRLDDVVSHTDVIEATTLTGHATTRLKRGAEVILIPTMQVDPSRVPVLGTYVVGDQVTVRADVGLEAIDGLFRITQQAVNVGEFGDETASLSFANVELF